MLLRLSYSVGASNANASTSVSRVCHYKDKIGMEVGIQSSDVTTGKITHVLETLITSSRKDRIQEEVIYSKQRLDSVKDMIEDYHIQSALTGKSI